MNRFISILLGILLLLGLSSELRAKSRPHLLIWDTDHLVTTKTSLDDPTPELQGAASYLRRQADKALENESYSVTYNVHVPPSGDKHDYASFAAYWWPDPAKEDGLPFIRRDGVTNQKQKRQGDRNHFRDFTRDVEALSLAYFYFDDERYAEHAIHLINDWFLNPDTRMNPHLQYAQAVPGRNDGKSSGIIDTRDHIYILESLELLKKSPSYCQALEDGLKHWFAEYFHWLRTSTHGKQARQAKNNHGSWYHAQALRIALFLGRYNVAQELLEEVREDLIPNQIASDGTQSEELARTNSFHYSLFNLKALALVARMGESLDYDLWHYHDKDGKGIQVAAEFLMPYVNGTSEWSHEQIKKYRISPGTNQLFRMFSVKFHEPGWLDVSAELLEGYPKYDPAMLITAAYQEDWQAE